MYQEKNNLKCAVTLVIPHIHCNQVFIQDLTY